MNTTKQKIKYLRVTMPDDSKWDVPADLIATNRAQYYAKLDGEGNPTEEKKIFEDELKYALTDDDELIDWAVGNMDWKDVAHYAIEVQKATPDFQEGWVSGEIEVVEI